MAESSRILVETLLYNSAAWLVTYFIHSSMILGAALLASRVSQLPPAWERFIWRTALVGGIVTASLQLAGAELTGADPRGSVVTLAGDPGRGVVFIAALTGLIAAVSVYRLHRAWARYRRRIRHRTPVRGSLLADLETVSRSAGYSGRLHLTRSDAVRCPIAIGAHEICIPARGFADLPLAQRRTVLAHELAHLMYRDQRWLLLSRLIGVALFFQPLNRVARHRLHQCAEFLADDFAVSHTADPVSLARALARIADWISTPDLIYGSEFAEPSLLLRRGRRILGNTRSARAPSIPARLTIVMGVVALAFVFPGARPPCSCRFLDAPPIQVVDSADARVVATPAAMGYKLHM